MSISVRVGQRAGVRRTLHQADFDRFAMLSGDDNPIHVDPAFAARTKFGRTVAHGMLLYSLVSGVLGSLVPGPGCVQVGQELMFPNPTYCDEQVDVLVQVEGVDAQGLATLWTTVTRSDGSVGLRGQARVIVGTALPATVNLVPAAWASEAAAGESFKGMAPGRRAEARRSFTGEDVAEYVALATDGNPIWTDPAYARRLGFAGLPVPGPLLASLLSYLLGTRLPGQGTNYLKQRLEFPLPAIVGQELAASVEIVRIRPDKQLVNLATTCTNPAGEIVCRGEALVLVSDVMMREPMS